MAIPGLTRLIDEMVLSSFMEDFDPDEVQESIESLRREARELAALGPAGADEAVAKRIADAAHGLRSTCAVIGATAVATICVEVERAGRSGDADLVNALIADLPECIERTTARLRDLAR